MKVTAFPVQWIKAAASRQVFIGFSSQTAKFMWPTCGPPGSCRPQVGPTLAPWTLLSGKTTALEHLPDKPTSACIGVIQRPCHVEHVPIVSYGSSFHFQFVEIGFVVSLLTCLGIGLGSLTLPHRQPPEFLPLSTAGCSAASVSLANDSFLDENHLSTTTMDYLIESSTLLMTDDTQFSRWYTKYNKYYWLFFKTRSGHYDI